MRSEGRKEGSEFLMFLRERLARRAKAQMLLQFEVPANVEFAIQISIQEAFGFFTVHVVTPYDELPQIPGAGVDALGSAGTAPSQPGCPVSMPTPYRISLRARKG